MNGIPLTNENTHTRMISARCLTLFVWFGATLCNDNVDARMSPNCHYFRVMWIMSTDIWPVWNSAYTNENKTYLMLCSSVHMIFTLIQVSSNSIGTISQQKQKQNQLMSIHVQIYLRCGIIFHNFAIGISPFNHVSDIEKLSDFYFILYLFNLDFSLSLN